MNNQRHIKWKLAGLAGVVATLLAMASGAHADDVKVTPTFGSDRGSLSYAIGVTTARNLVRDGVEVDVETLVKGINDGLQGKPTMLSEMQIRELMNGLVTSMRQKYTANRHAMEESNRKRGDEYRARFAKESGVRTLPSGVLIQPLETGKGPTPRAEDKVEVSYQGTLVDGKEFDATPQGRTVSFELGRVIPGWRDALSTMPVGSHWKVVVPPDQAYGDRGIGTGIGPNETLVFDIRLVSVAATH